MTVQQDRRDVSVRRIPFEALVEIGGDGTPAFEAESVDVSTGGMHLRSAYLPELGQSIVCRFDTGDGEPICAEGHVVWREEGTRGGELGIQFTNVDEPSAAALLEMCGVPPAEVEPPANTASKSPAPSSSGAERGSRVRLHIEGLAAPMKARVRQVGDKQILVGSNLDFLRLGRALELESVEQRERRPAQVEQVAVEIDPASMVPQLVVELRYADVAHDDTPVVPATVATVAKPAAPEPRPEPRPAPRPEPRSEARPEPASFDEAEEQEDEVHLRPTAEPPVRARTAVEAADDPMSDDELEVAHSMKNGLSRAAMRVGPAIASVGSRAKTTMQLLFAKSRGIDEVDDRVGPPRRTTAPAPGGALQALGRRVVREEGPASEASAAPSKKRSRAIALGAAAGVASVLLVLAFRKPATPPPGAPETTDLAATTTIPVTEPASSATVLANVSPDTVVANVPLFGPTPLSTIAQPPPPPPAAELAAEPQAPIGPAAAFAQAAAVDPMGMDDFEAPTERAKPRAEAQKPAEKKAAKVAAFKHGKVTNPKTLRLRMDDAITSLKGSRSSDGFTVTLADRRAKEKAGPLASKDDRILSSRVINSAKGAELTIRFRDDVPAFAVRADGQELVIELETAKKSKPTATAKKGSVGKKN